MARPRSAFVLLFAVGTFNSIWRRESDGRWRVIFDRGCPPCDCGETP